MHRNHENARRYARLCDPGQRALRAHLSKTVREREKMKTAIVTGAASGIGLAVAKKFLAEGYVVCGMSRRDVSPITHERFHYIPGDISVAADREKLVAAAQRIDALVNVAGVAPKVRTDLLEMTEESYDHVMDINLKGTFFLTRRLRTTLRAILFQPPISSY